LQSFVTFVNLDNASLVNSDAYKTTAAK